MARKLALEFRHLGRKFVVGGKQLAELDEGADDGNGDRDGARAAQDAGEHGNTLFGEDGGGFARATMPGS